MLLVQGNTTILLLSQYIFIGCLFHTGSCLSIFYLFINHSINGLCPQYLMELLEHRKSTQSLRSNSQDLLMQPTCKTKTYGDRAFSICAPKLWNTVPLEIRRSSTLLLFKKNSRLSFLLNLLRVTLYHIFKFKTLVF